MRGEASQLALVFQNLLTNAMKYCPEGVHPAIDISARAYGSHWIVSVRDNGIGFDQKYAAQIFGLFKRLHKDKYPGTGLGLAICHRIIERYSGRMWAESAPGQGPPSTSPFRNRLNGLQAKEKPATPAKGCGLDG